MAGLLALTVVVTGCASDGPPSPAPGAAAAAQARAPVAATLTELRRVPDVLTTAGTSRARTTLRSASGGTRVTVSGEGVFDFRRRTGELRVALPRQAPGVAAREPLTELFVPGALFMKNRGAGVPPGKWVRLETAALPDGNLVSGGATDPWTAAALLRGARWVRDAGSERLGGVAVRRHRGVTDLAAAARATPVADAAPALEAAAKGFGAEAGVPFEAWIDARGRLRKVRYVLSIAGSEVESTTWLDGFGTPVRLTLPASDDIWTGSLAATG